MAEQETPTLATLEGAPTGCYRDCIGDLWLWGGVRRWYCLVPRGADILGADATPGLMEGFAPFALVALLEAPDGR